MNDARDTHPRPQVQDQPEPQSLHDDATRESEVPEPARLGDPSVREKASETAAAKVSRPGVEWVRPTELVALRSAQVAGRGIDFQAELARRARKAPGQAYRVVRARQRTDSQRAERLPPVSAFGRGRADRFSWMSRSGIGRG